MTKGKVDMPAIQRVAVLGFSLLLFAVSQQANAQQKIEFKFDLKDIFKTDNTTGKPAPKPAGETPVPQEPSLPAGIVEANQTGQQGSIDARSKPLSAQIEYSPIVATQLGEPVANLLSKHTRRYFKNGAGIDTYEFLRFTDYLADSTLFPEVDKSQSNPGCENQRIGAKRNLACDRVIRSMNNKIKILRNTGEFLKTVRPGQDSRFDQHMSALIGVAFEIGSDQLFNYKIDLGKAVAWYESALNIDQCTNWGTSRSYSCNKGRYLARARLGFMCIAGHACTSDLEGNKEAWQRRGVELIGSLVDEVKRWDAAGGDINHELLDYVHYFAIFIPAEIQFKLANIRARKIRDLFVTRGTVRPHPDWITYTSANESYMGVPCVPEPSKANQSKWNSREFDSISPKALGGAWVAVGIDIDWLTFSALAGYEPAVTQVKNSAVYYDTEQKAHTSLTVEMEKEYIAKINAAWEKELAGRLRDWRRGLKPNVNVRWADGEAAEFTVAKVTGGQAISILYERDVCVAGTNYHNRYGAIVDSECDKWRKENFRYQADISKLLPMGYDGNGIPVNSGGAVWIGNSRKVVDGQLIEVAVNNCGITRNLQALWNKKYGMQ